MVHVSQITCRNSFTPPEGEETRSMPYLRPLMQVIIDVEFVLACDGQPEKGWEKPKVPHNDEGIWKSIAWRDVDING